MGTHILEAADNPISGSPAITPTEKGMHLIVSGAPSPADDGFWYSVDNIDPTNWKQAAHRPPYDSDVPGPTGVALTPEYIGQTFTDTNAEEMYFAIGDTDENDWRKAGGGMGGVSNPMLARPENMVIIRRSSQNGLSIKVLDDRYCGNPVPGVVGRDATPETGDEVGFEYLTVHRHESFNVNAISRSIDGGQSWVTEPRENLADPATWPTKHGTGLNVDRGFHLAGFGFNYAMLSNDEYVSVVDPTKVVLFMDGWSDFLDRHYVVWNTRATNTKFFLQGAAAADGNVWNAFTLNPNGTRGRYALFVPETNGVGDYFFYGVDGIAPGGTLTRFVVPSGQELRTDLDAGRVPIPDTFYCDGTNFYFATGDEEGDYQGSAVKVWRITGTGWNNPLAGQVTAIKLWDSSTDSGIPGAPLAVYQRARKGMLVAGNNDVGLARIRWTYLGKIYEFDGATVADITGTTNDAAIMNYNLGYEPWTSQWFYLQGIPHSSDEDGPSPEGGQVRDKNAVYGIALPGANHDDDPERQGFLEPSTWNEDETAGAAAEGGPAVLATTSRWHIDAMGCVGFYGNHDDTIQWYARALIHGETGGAAITPHPFLKRFV